MRSLSDLFPQHPHDRRRGEQGNRRELLGNAKIGLLGGPSPMLQHPSISKVVSETQPHKGNHRTTIAKELTKDTARIFRDARVLLRAIHAGRNPGSHPPLDDQCSKDQGYSQQFPMP